MKSFKRSENVEASNKKRVNPMALLPRILGRAIKQFFGLLLVKPKSSGQRSSHHPAAYTKFHSSQAKQRLLARRAGRVE